MLRREYESPTAIEPQRELASPVAREWVGMSRNQVGDASGGHEIREPRAQLARAGLAELLLLQPVSQAKLLLVLVVVDDPQVPLRWYLVR